MNIIQPFIVYCVIGGFVTIIFAVIYIFGDNYKIADIEDFAQASSLGLLAGVAWPITIVITLLSLFCFCLVKVVKKL